MGDDLRSVPVETRAMLASLPRWLRIELSQHTAAERSVFATPANSVFYTTRSATMTPSRVGTIVER